MSWGCARVRSGRAERELQSFGRETLGRSRGNAEALHFFVQSRGADAQAGSSAPLMAMVLFKSVKNQSAFKFPDETSEVARLHCGDHRYLLRCVSNGFRGRARRLSGAALHAGNEPDRAWGHRLDRFPKALAGHRPAEGRG